MKRKLCAFFLAGALAAGLAACGGTGSASSGKTASSSTESKAAGSGATESEGPAESSAESSEPAPAAPARGSTLTAYMDVTSVEEKEKIEKALNLANMEDVLWTYDAANYAWVLSPVTAVAYPEIKEEQGVSVCVPAAYTYGIDTAGDGKADVRADNYQKPVRGSLVINPWGQMTSKYGILYTASTAPTIFTTGAEGYGAQENPTASAEYAANGYISVACGNRGKQSKAADANGRSYFTGDSPACLVDQKNAIRFVKYNMLLGNLPGNVNYFVTTGGSYLDLYLAEFVENLQWTLDNLSYAEGWTWFDANGSRLPDWTAQNMSKEERALAFLTGRYAKKSSGKEKRRGGKAGTPGAGTTQAAGSSVDSKNYASFEDLLEAYESDIAEIKAGDRYGKNPVNLYDPMSFIGIPSTENPTWARLVMGAAEGDMPLFASLNLQLRWLSVGTDAAVEWQWDGGHVPSEILGESLPLYVDKMYGKHVGAKNAEGETVMVEVQKPAAYAQGNGTAAAPEGRDISSWVNHGDLSKVSFTLAAAAAYRTASAVKAVPGFDVIDYGQECYVFGDSKRDCRHWNERLLEVFQDNELSLSGLFGR